MEDIKGGISGVNDQLWSTQGDPKMGHLNSATSP